MRFSFLIALLLALVCVMTASAISTPVLTSAPAKPAKAPASAAQPTLSPQQASVWAKAKAYLLSSKKSVSDFYKEITGKKTVPVAGATPSPRRAAAVKGGAVKGGVVKPATKPAAKPVSAAVTPAAAKENVSIVSEAKRTFFNDKLGLKKLWTKLTKFHYEHRDAKNGKHVSYEEAIAKGSGWQLLPPKMSVYHDNGRGKPELKFVHPNGREAVFDGDTLLPVTDPKYRATYNYVAPLSTTDVKGVGSAINFAARGVGHVITDVIPYKVLGGNNRKP